MRGGGEMNTPPASCGKAPFEVSFFGAAPVEESFSMSCGFCVIKKVGRDYIGFKRVFEMFLYGF